MRHTGEKCVADGIYEGRCARGHTEQGRFEAGETFTPCSTGACGGQRAAGGGGGRPMTWELLEAPPSARTKS